MKIPEESRVPLDILAIQIAMSGAMSMIFFVLIT